MRLAKRTLRAVVLFAAGAFFLFLSGFALFVQHVADYEEPRDVAAEGIVALTGGASRISDALDLLQQGRARRLLITGVHPVATPREIAAQQQRPGALDLFNCCIDLDRRALNTAGNAEQTRNWVERRGFRSLIVVTSEYHMPRSLTELARVLPDVRLVPYPVSSPVMREGESWADVERAQLLLSEYVKYVFSLARQTLEQPTPRVTVAQAGRSHGFGY